MGTVFVGISCVSRGDGDELTRKARQDGWVTCRPRLRLIAGNFKDCGNEVNGVYHGPYSMQKYSS